MSYVPDFGVWLGGEVAVVLTATHSAPFNIELYYRVKGLSNCLNFFLV